MAVKANIEKSVSCFFSLFLEKGKKLRVDGVFGLEEVIDFGLASTGCDELGGRDGVMTAQLPMLGHVVGEIFDGGFVSLKGEFEGIFASFVGLAGDFHAIKQIIKLGTAGDHNDQWDKGGGSI